MTVYLLCAGEDKCEVQEINAKFPKDKHKRSNENGKFP